MYHANSLPLSIPFTHPDIPLPFSVQEPPAGIEDEEDQDQEEDER